MHRSICASLLLASLCVASPVAAQVTLPNGLAVPVDSMVGEVQLFTLFSMRGEAIDWVADASRTPDTFSPLCGFTATLVLHEASSSIGVGWYNVVPGAVSAPTLAEIYEIVPAGAAVGTTITGSSIRDDPRYRGGLVGFALRRTPAHFTESRWNTVCNVGACAATPGPWILSLSYASVSTPNAWYVAFEDGDTTASSWNNDGDYNDYVFFFTGLTCAGGGEACEIPEATGVCAVGITECDLGGAVSCRGVNPPSDERCDGADSDCDGAIDEGEGLCAGLQICLAGRCVDRCFEGGCSSGEVCTEGGACVEEACVDVTCPTGERCVGGSCGDACAGVVCPADGVCVAGRCIDRCAGVECEEGRVCEGGICVDSCECRFCGAGRECGGGGVCVDEGCALATCAPGSICRAGGCVDACDGVVCPVGQACELGACEDIPPVTAMDAGLSADGGGPGDGGGGADAGAGGAMDAGGAGPSSGESGCGCRAGSRGAGGGALLSIVLVLGLALRRRRRPTRPHEGGRRSTSSASRAAWDLWSLR